MYDKNLGSLIEPFNKDNIIELYNSYTELGTKVANMRNEHDALVNSYKELEKMHEHMQNKHAADISRIKEDSRCELLNVIREHEDKIQAERLLATQEYKERAERLWADREDEKAAEIKKLMAANEELKNENKTFIKVMDNQSNIIDILLKNQRAAIEEHERMIRRGQISLSEFKKNLPIL